MNNFKVHVLFDPCATHSFIARRIVTKIGQEVKIIGKGFVIKTPSGNRVETNSMYVGVGVSLARYETEVDLIPLELHDFDVILSIDWLSKYKAQIHCYTKTVVFLILEGRRMVFKGERIPNLINLVSVVTTGSC